MLNENYRNRVNVLAIVASGAFAGGNLFIGLSIGPYWLSLSASEFVDGFGQQFRWFLVTIMPLFILTLLGLILSAKVDWNNPVPKQNWLLAIASYTAISIITVAFHMPENLRLLEENYTESQAEFARLYWLAGHIPRVLLAVAISVFAARAASFRPSETSGATKTQIA